MTRLHYQLVATEKKLRELCARWTDAPVVALDTEFVSEHSFRPELCLIQVAVSGQIYLIDPLLCQDLNVFWQWLATPGRRTVVHAGREELRFSWRAIRQFPHDVFDVQLAAAFVGYDYPIAYTTLVAQLLKVSLSKDQTRSDWRRRPLSVQQLEYAARDVAYLEPLAEMIGEQLRDMRRQTWFAEEVEQWKRDLQEAETNGQWRRLPGLSKLTPRSLAVARELWLWRQKEAELQNVPPRWLLRDDLLVELARRQSADIQRIRSVRGLERENLLRFLPLISHAIQRGLNVPGDELPMPSPRTMRPKLTVAGQFLLGALSSICRQAKVATSLVGSSEDLRDLIAYRLGLEGAPKEPPRLARGWRAEVVGGLVEQLLAGELAIRIRDPTSDQPLEFLAWPPTTNSDAGQRREGTDPLPDDE